jgi:hypothetical protein
MKRLVRVGLVVAMVLAAVTPAVAQVSQENAARVGGGGEGVELRGETQSEGGGMELGGEVANEGDYAGQCVPATQFGNTVTPQSQLDVLQYASELDDIEIDGGGSLNLLQYGSELGDVEGDDGSPMSFEPTLEASCQRSVGQSSGAG